MLKDFTARLYQETILGTAVRTNTMVVLPTGLGKTFIFLMLAEIRLKQFPLSKVVMLAPTKPLVEQHLKSAQAHMPSAKSVFLTGEISPEKRQELWNDSNLIFSTPQTIENDLFSRRISLKDVSLLCLDECHRATGDYSYVYIAQEYMQKAQHPRILGLTASPGSEIEVISEIVQNLSIEEIEARTFEDGDVKPYIKEINISLIEVDLPEKFKEIKKYLDNCYKEKIELVAKFLGTKVDVKMSKKGLLELQREIFSRIQTEQEPLLYNAVSVLAQAIKVNHAQELLETQGVFALVEYMKRMAEQATTSSSKAAKNLVLDVNFKSAKHLAMQLKEEGIQHPKLKRLLEIVKEELERKKDVKIIIFNHYRDSAKRLVEKINEFGSSMLFVGQMKKGGTGLSQKKQKEMLDMFRSQDFNVLVSTSIGEEGLDIPAVDLVIFYEPVPSAIRSIQRRGRTGRQEEGRVIILITKETRDVVYKWASHYKEKRMHRLLTEIKQRLKIDPKRDSPEQMKLNPFSEENREGVRIIIDTRERGSAIVKRLQDKGAKLELKKIDSADYICSKDVGIEFKTSDDFINSIADKRLLMQAKMLKENFTKPLMIIQEHSGDSIARMISPEAKYGALASVALDFGIPILYTKGPRETGDLIYSIAKTEQEQNGSEFSMHANKPLTLKEQQEYIVSALPGIGPKLARPLLESFKSIKGIIEASSEDLQKVPLVGKKKAESIKNVLEGLYQTQESHIN